MKDSIDILDWLWSVLLILAETLSGVQHQTAVLHLSMTKKWVTFSVLNAMKNIVWSVVKEYTMEWLARSLKLTIKMTAKSRSNLEISKLNNVQAVKSVWREIRDVIIWPAAFANMSSATSVKQIGFQENAVMDYLKMLMTDIIKNKSIQ